MVPNESLLNKADMALSDLSSKGLLQPAQAQKFLKVLIDEAVLLKMATVVGMASPKQQIDKIKFGSRILRNGAENVALSSADRAKPTMSQVELDCKLFKAEVRLNNEVLEDSIERGDFRSTVMQLMAERIATDLDELLVRGDTSSSDTYLATMNGLLKQITTNTYDHTDTTANRTLWKSMIKTMPSAFIRNKKSLKFLTSLDAETDYRDSLVEAASAPYGSQFIETDAPAKYSGIDVVSVPLFAENVGTSSHCTNAVLIDPKNVTVGIWRDIKVETDKLISEGVLLIVATLRFDMKLAEETAAVKASNIKVV